MSGNRKVVKYRKPFHINIGIIIFFIIFLYIIFNIFTYFTKKHVSVYEVEQGTIVENNTYQGLALRTESVVNASTAGYINYYLQEFKKAAYNSLICSIDQNGDVTKKIAEANKSNNTITDESRTDIGNTINDYVNSYSNTGFYNIYNFKDNLNSQISEAINLQSLNSIGDYTQYAQSNSTFQLNYAPTPGLVTYYTDGYETVTTDSFQPAMMNELNYKKNNLQDRQTINNGDPLYTLITDENWNIIVNVNEKTYESLANTSSLQIEFKEDQKKVWTTLTEKQIDGNYYLILALNNSMIRYANERFVEIELLISEKSGLKIPNTAITSKDFFTIPTEYFSKGDDSSDLGVLEKSSTTNSVTFTPLTVYYSKDDNYYIDKNDITAGTVLQKADSSDTYTVNTSASLNGVYNINKGYAIFKQIDILYQNEEYSVVKTGTDYGISLYDHIALNGSNIKEDSFIN